MTPKEKAICAFELKKCEGLVPTFELEFQLSQELSGKKHIFDKELKSASSKNELERLIKENAQLYAQDASTLDYSIVSLTYGPYDIDYLLETIKEVKKLVGDERLIGLPLDATMSIPSGSSMMDLIMEISDYPEDMHINLASVVETTIEKAKRLREAGADTALLCSDYCFNDGPFLSPKMFSEFVTPYLSSLISQLRDLGYYTIKHTDGNIMPILDQLISANPHALHSIDPQAGVDLKEVKEITKGKIALCGNVHCGMLHNGTKEQIIEDSKRSLKEGMPDGGYFFCSSNTPFIGMPLENYLTMLEVRKEYGCY